MLSGGIGKMDWCECIKNKVVKDVKVDSNQIESTKKIAAVKIESAGSLPEHLFIGKITLLYDALREYLECIALKKGYKIYNHECYTAFLKEILKISKEAGMFDELRKIRNGINYYGRNVSKEESEKIINDLNFLIKIFQKQLR